MRPIWLAAVVAGCAILPSVAFAQPSPPVTPVASPAMAPSAASDASAAPSIDPAVTARAKDWLHRAQTANIDRSQLDSQMNTLLTDDLTKQVAAKFGPLGDPLEFSNYQTKSFPDGTAYVYHVKFKTSSLYWVFAVGRDGKISGLRFLPE